MALPLSIGWNVPFDEAIQATVSRGVVLPDVYYGKLQGIHRQFAFSIANVAKVDQLQAVLDSLTHSLNTGGTFANWQRNVDVKALGLQPHRLDNIFRTNIQSAYNSGHWQQQLANKSTRPYLVYDAINDSRTRPSHKANDGIIRQIDDPIWKRIWFSRNVYRCRCRLLISLSEEQAIARSKNGTGLQKTETLDPKRDTAWDNVDVMNADVMTFGIERAIAKRLASEVVDAGLLGALSEQLAKASEVRYWKEGTGQAPWHDASFKDSPEWLKQAILKYDDDFKGTIGSITGKDAFYRPSSGIHMGKEDIANIQGQGTWRHEYGHYLDDKIGMNSTGLYRSNSSDFKSAIKTDTDVILKQSGLGRKSKSNDVFLDNRRNRQQKLVNDFSLLSKEERASIIETMANDTGIPVSAVNDFFNMETVHSIDSIGRDVRIGLLLDAVKNKDAASFMRTLAVDKDKDVITYNKGLTGKFSDLVGSATKNKLLGHGKYGYGGHTNQYYKSYSGAAETEVFANLTALLGAENVFWQKTTEAFYPTLTKLFKEVLSNG